MTAINDTGPSGDAGPSTDEERTHAPDRPTVVPSFKRNRPRMEPDAGILEFDRHSGVMRYEGEEVVESILDAVDDVEAGVRR